jgi:hypothetical protein
MDRIKLFSDARARCSIYLESEPGGWLWPTLIEQIDYLMDLERQLQTDRDKLPNVCIGPLAAKNIEDRDQELCQILYNVQEEADKMNNPHRTA